MHIDIDPAVIHVASEHSAAVLASVVASRERVLASITNHTLEGAMLALGRATA